MRAAELCALIVLQVLRVIIGSQAIFLTHSAVGQLVSCGAAQARHVLDVAGIDHVDFIVCIPHGAVLNAALQAGNNAQGIGRAWINGAIYLDPVADQRDLIGLFIVDGISQIKELAVDHHLRKIHLQAWIHVDRHGNCGAGADSLCQHQQQLPCGSGAVHLTLAHEGSH